MRMPLGDSERAYVLRAGARYFGSGGDRLAEWLDIPTSSQPVTTSWTAVPLPEWAAAIGVGPDNHILVERGCVLDGPGPAFWRTDWWRAAFLHMKGWLERSVEDRDGPIHSYACRLPAATSPLYDHAWVNRIFLLLRRWASATREQVEEDLFPPRPVARFDLTHDVDAVRKTVAIRLKQATFNTVNAARELIAARPARSMGRLGKAVRVAMRRGDYWGIPRLQSLEEAFGVRSTFHVFGGATGWRRPVHLMLLDPSYKPDSPPLRAAWRRLAEGGWSLGLHPSFDSWRDPRRMAAERTVVEMATGMSVVRCRQHWLRFSWEHTWKAQQEAGLGLDATLGFNDRPGFRNGCALSFQPWDTTSGAPLRIQVVPLLLMDSHLYDYALHDDATRLATIDRWIGEVKAVGGEVSLLWHTHVLDADYGWEAGYRELLSRIT